MFKSLKKNAFYSVLKTFLSLIFPLVTFPYVAHILLPSGIGKINFANNIIQYFVLIAGLGVNIYGVREAAKIRNDRKKLTQFVKEIFLINAISTLIAYAILVLLIYKVSGLFNYRRLLFILSSTILFTTFGMEWLYNALEEFKYITIRAFIFQCIALVLLFIFVKTKSDYEKYACISAFSNVGSNICNFIHSRKYINFKEKIGKFHIKKHLNGIFTLFIGSIAVSIYTILDTTMVGFFLGDTAVGIYTAANKINKIIVSFIAALNIVILPRLSFYIENDKEKYLLSLNKSVKFLLMVAIPLSVGLFSVSKEIIILMCGSKFSESILPCQIMTPIITMITLSLIFSNQILIPLRKDLHNIIPTIIGAIVNFLFNFLFIPKIGVIGASLGTVIAESLIAIMKGCIANKYIKIKVLLVDLIQFLFATSLMLVCMELESKYIQLSLFAILVIKVISGIFIYSTSLYLLKNKTFLETLSLILNFLLRGSN